MRARRKKTSSRKPVSKTAAHRVEREMRKRRAAILSTFEARKSGHDVKLAKGSRDVSVRTRDPRKGFVDVHGVAVAKIVGKPGHSIATHPGKLTPDQRTRYADRFAGDALETLLGSFDPVDSRIHRLRAALNVLTDYEAEIREASKFVIKARNASTPEEIEDVINELTGR